ncbi:MAG: hypothetical protein PWP52_2290 [Bacteroidales bacterium]|nr:hypothetical protein [Bacteroidales bacterium]
MITHKKQCVYIIAGDKRPVIVSGKDIRFP